MMKFWCSSVSAWIWSWMSRGFTVVSFLLRNAGPLHEVNSQSHGRENFAQTGVWWPELRHTCYLFGWWWSLDVVSQGWWWANFSQPHIGELFFAPDNLPQNIVSFFLRTLSWLVIAVNTCWWCHVRAYFHCLLGIRVPAPALARAARRIHFDFRFPKTGNQNNFDP